MAIVNRIGEEVIGEKVMRESKLRRHREASSRDIPCIIMWRYAENIVDV